MQEKQDFPEVAAQNRMQLGTSAARLLRKEGKIPAIIYGNNEEVAAIIVDLKVITKLYGEKNFSSRVLNLLVNGKSQRVLPHAAQFHRIKGQITHLDFLRLGTNTQEVKVSIVYEDVERSIGVKLGGYFNIVCREVKLECPANEIPRFIKVNMLDMPIGRAIKAKDLIMPANCKLLVNPNLVIASIIGKGGKEKTDTAVTT